MKLFTKEKYPFEIAWVAFTLIITIFFLYKEVVKKPNLLLSNGGDGLKNYYTYLYHIKNDATYWKFDGMNYPFGENIIFTDNQPFLVNTVKFLKNIFPTIECNAVAIHNLFLLLGLLWGGIGLFLVFRQLKVDFIFALMVSVGLIIMNPQIPRFNGHFGLFYPSLPWIFWWLIRIKDGEHPIRLSLWIALFTLITGLLHMYHFLTSAFLCLLFAALSFDFKFNHKTLLSLGIKISIQIVLPFILLTFFSSYYCYASDRPSNPYGFFEYRSFWEGLFFSYRLPLYNFINNNIVPVRELNFEGMNYIGILAVATFLILLVRLIFRNKEVRRFFNIKTIEGFYFWLFFVVALIGFGIPFIIPGLEGLLDYTGPFKQFRSVGRLTWICFYAINIFTIVIVYQYIESIKDEIKRSLFYFAIPTVVLIEGLWFQHFNQFSQINISEFSCENELKKLPIKAEEFQAILPNPYFSIGAESLGWWDLGEVMRMNYELGYNLGLPSLGANLSRTSYSQAFSLNELVCKPYKVPQIIQQLKQKDQRPLLVLETKAESWEKRNALNHWTEKAPILFENDRFRLRKLSLNQFDTIVENFVAEKKRALDTIPSTQNFLTTEFKLTDDKEGTHYLSELSINDLSSGRYYISYWIDMSIVNSARAITEAWQYDSSGKELDFVSEANHYNYKLFDGKKALIEIPIQIRPETKKMAFKIKTPDKNSPLSFSKFMIYKEGSMIKQVENNKLFLNNYLLP